LGAQNFQNNLKSSTAEESQVAAENHQRFTSVGGVKSGAHMPEMENLIGAMAEKEKLFKEVNNMVKKFDKKYKE
jgi:hypothetical protein